MFFRARTLYVHIIIQLQISHFKVRYPIIHVVHVIIRNSVSVLLLQPTNFSRSLYSEMQWTQQSTCNVWVTLVTKSVAFYCATTFYVKPVISISAPPSISWHRSASGIRQYCLSNAAVVCLRMAATRIQRPAYQLHARTIWASRRMLTLRIVA